MTRRLSRAPRGDAGLSLAETLVALLVGSIVMTAALTMFVTAQRSGAATRARQDNINQAKTSVEAMGRNLRTAIQPNQLEDTTNTDVAFQQGGPRFVSFYANVDNADNTVGPSKVTYAVDTSNRLLQIVQAPNAHVATDHNYLYCSPTVTSCLRRVRVLAENLDPAVTLFNYYDDQDVNLATSATCTQAADIVLPASTTACLPSTTLGTVNSIEIKIVVRPPSGVRIGATTYILRVSLPNRESIIRATS